MIRRSGFLAIIAITMANAAALAQQQCEDRATLIQTVRDKNTQTPLAGALVTALWSGGSVSAMTDSLGNTTICAPGGRTITLRVTYHDLKIPAQTTSLTLSRPTRHTVTVDAPAVLIRGVIVDDETGTPIAQAAVKLAHTSLNAVTGADGRFVFVRVPIGDYILRTEHLSYAASSMPLEVRGEDLDASIRLAPTAIPLSPLTVSAFSVRLERVGFYDRKKRGVGTFIDRKQVDDMDVLRSSDLLRGVPSMRIIPQASRRNAPPNATIGRGNCRFKFVVDGTRTLPDFEMDMVAPFAIEGVEVYNGLSEIPAEFRAITETGAGTCGVIAIWTRDRR